MRLAFGRQPGTVLRWSVCAALLALAACGGGGSGGSTGSGPSTPTTPVNPPVDPLLEAARTARVTGTFDGATRDMKLQWTDGFNTESGFRVERLDGSEWKLSATVPASAGSGKQIEWTVPSAGNFSYRVLAVANGTTYQLKTASGADAISSEMPTPLPALILSGGSLQGTVQLTVSNAPAGASVRYFVDYQALGGTLQVSPYQQALNTASYGNGNRLLQALVQVSQDQTWVIGTQYYIDNPTPTPGLNPTIDASYDSFTDTSRIRVVAPSDFGIASVQFFVDGQAQPPMTLPNGCVYVVSCSSSATTRLSPPWAYDLKMKHADWPHGNHVVRAVIIDNMGTKSELSLLVPTNAPPVIKVSSLLDNQILVDPSVRLQAQVSDDLGTADVSVVFNGSEVLHQGAGPIDLTLPLTVKTGTFIDLRAQDAQAKKSSVSLKLYYQPDSAFRPQVMIHTQWLYTVNGDMALMGWWRDENSHENYLVQRVRGSAASGLERVTLEFPDKLVFADFAASGDWVATRAYVQDPQSISMAIHAWGPDGKRRNLTEETGTGSPVGNAIGTGGWFAWTTGNYQDPATVRLRLMQMSTGRTLSLQSPVSTLSIVPDDVALAPVGNEVKAIFRIANKAGQPGGIYLFDSATGLTQALSPAGLLEREVQTDGQRVMWRRYAANLNGVDDPYSIVAAPLSNPTASTILSTAAKDAKLADGLLGWNERGLTSNALKVNDGKETVVISNRLDAVLATVGGGAVALYSGSQLQLWTPALGPRMVFDVSQDFNGIPINGPIHLTRGWLYFKIGNASALHRVPF